MGSRWAVGVAAFGLVAACASDTPEEPSDEDRAASGRADAGAEPTAEADGGAAPPSVEPEGGTAGGGSAATAGSGGSPSGGAASGGAPGSASGGAAGTPAGVVPAVAIEPLPDVITRDGTNCWFVHLGGWLRCAEVSEAEYIGVYDSRSECAASCLADPSCTSIIDWTWFGAGCRTFDTAQCTPTTTSYGEEDAGRVHAVLCGDDPPEGAITEMDDLPGLVSDPTSGCRYLLLEGLTCPGGPSLSSAPVVGLSLVDCLAACERDPTCTAVRDDVFGTSTHECALHFESCDDPVASDDYNIRFYRKECRF